MADFEIKKQKLEEADYKGKDVAALSDYPSLDGMSADYLKKRFDNVPENILGKDKHNGLIDALTSIADGSSGAQNIGVSPIDGIDAGTVQAALVALMDAFSASGNGDMYKKDYDTDRNGKVDAADVADNAKALNGKAESALSVGSAANAANAAKLNNKTEGQLSVANAASLGGAAASAFAKLAGAAFAGPVTNTGSFSTTHANGFSVDASDGSLWLRGGNYYFRFHYTGANLFIHQYDANKSAASAKEILRLGNAGDIEVNSASAPSFEVNAVDGSLWLKGGSNRYRLHYGNNNILYLHRYGATGSTPISAPIVIGTDDKVALTLKNVVATVPYRTDVIDVGADSNRVWTSANTVHVQALVYPKAAMYASTLYILGKIPSSIPYPKAMYYSTIFAAVYASGEVVPGEFSINTSGEILVNWFKKLPSMFNIDAAYQIV